MTNLTIQRGSPRRAIEMRIRVGGAVLAFVVAAQFVAMVHG